MKLKATLVAAAIVMSLGPGAFAQTGYVPSKENISTREKFASERFGIFIHWGIYSMMSDGEWIMNSKGLPYDEYSRLAAGFCPSKFNADEWAKAFKSSGARYVTFTSRHHDGFSMFDTAASDYDIVDASPFKRDVVKELSDALSRQGLALSFYYSLLDWGRNDYYPLGNTGHRAGRPEGDASSWQSYLNFMKSQLTELLTNYGPIQCIWFDGLWDKYQGETQEEQAEKWQIFSLYELIHSLQPSCMVGNNHHRPLMPGEDIQIFEKDVPGENTSGFIDEMSISVETPLETCQTIDDSWGYNMSDRRYKSSDYLIKYLVRTAGKGANLLLNVGPRPDGSLPEVAVQRLEDMGRWLGKYGETIYNTDGGCVAEQSWGVTTQKDNLLYVHVLDWSESIFLPLKGAKLINARLFEDGSRVQFSQVSDGIVLSLPAKDMDCPDQIITLTFKESL